MKFNTLRIATFNVNDHKQFRQKDDYLVVLFRKHIFAATIILF